MAARHRMELWCPFVELDSSGKKYNAVAIVDPDSGLVGTAHEFHYLALRRHGLDVGPAIRVFKRPWGTLGCLVCFDIHYPEVSRVLAALGAEVVFWPTLTAGPWSIEAVRAKASVRCMDNGFWLIESNLACPPPYAPYANRWEPGSCVFDPEGVMTANTGRRPGVCLVDVDLNRRSFGSHIVNLSGKEDHNVCEDLRDEFMKCLRSEYYGKFYSAIARKESSGRT